METITVTFEIDEDVFGDMMAKAQPVTEPCVCCDVRRALRFVPADPKGVTVDMCLNCVLLSPDVVKIVAE